MYFGAYLFVSVLTATGAVIFVVLLWVAFKSTVETMLPELWKPGVPEVVFRTKFKVVLIKPLHISRLELDGNTTGCFPNKAICYIIPVCPSVTAKKHKERQVENVQQTQRPRQFICENEYTCFTVLQSKQNLHSFFWICGGII